ncbi:MAG: hypothetical protein DLM67_13325 [Candidatus Nephthysia bennettiae]|uniref:Uncharacterized protein n=1 Tax=Candidatus Nephthysia bennettiae TaxID=3127016 RepID=A0A934K8D5_9BACT|nr:hypothetical protein [Candidatus Dormibacteraeota bacterium]MBJ7613148.1 hypothetical protein [Candidatus Dormibacteraeota bacterium]PZR93776.1 MAG: hypothetical protein DLM67_13325 [Candidatus Dormibacteraeota bacterium]
MSLPNRLDHLLRGWKRHLQRPPDQLFGVGLGDRARPRVQIEQREGAVVDPDQRHAHGQLIEQLGQGRERVRAPQRLKELSQRW